MKKIIPPTPPESSLIEGFKDEIEKIHIEIIKFFKSKKDPLENEIIEYGESIGLNDKEIYRHIAQILSKIIYKGKSEGVISELLQINPIQLDKLSPIIKDREILRFSMLAELDAINVYEQMAEYASNEDVKTVLRDVAFEEKVHAEEFKQVLIRVSQDAEVEKAMNQAKKEVDELIEEE
jgi:ribonucleotide reductase beta subunit family protein with ferritin-like domain